MAITVSTSFTSTGSSGQMVIMPGETLNFVLSGTFVATLRLEEVEGGGATYKLVNQYTAAIDDQILNPTNSPIVYRWSCSAFTSGTAVTSLVDMSDIVQAFKDAQGNTVMSVYEDSTDIAGALTVGGDTLVDGYIGVGLPSGTAAFGEIHIHEESASGTPMIKWSNSATGAGNAEGLEIILSGDESVKFRLYENTSMHFDVNNVEQLNFSTSSVVWNDPGNNVDFRVESADNDNMIHVDGCKNHIGLGTPASSVHFAYFLPDAETLASTAAWRTVTIADAGITTYSSGTHESIYGLRVEIPDITISSSGVVTNAASVSIAGAPHEATNNYALWVDAGVSRFDGDIKFDTSSFSQLTFKGGQTIGDNPSTTSQMQFQLNNSTDGGSWHFLLGASDQSALHMKQDGDGTGVTVFNDGAIARDFLVEGASSNHLFFIDSSNDSVSIGVNNVTPSVTANQPFAVFANDATTQSVLFDNDGTGRWNWLFKTDGNGDAALILLMDIAGHDSGGADQTYAQIKVETVLDNAGAETGDIQFAPAIAASPTILQRITGDVLGPGVYLENNAGFYMKETSERLARTDYGCLWTESDNTLHFRNGAGTEYTVDLTAV